MSRLIVFGPSLLGVHAISLFPAKASGRRGLALTKGKRAIRPRDDAFSCNAAFSMSEQRGMCTYAESSMGKLSLPRFGLLFRIHFREIQVIRIVNRVMYSFIGDNERGFEIRRLTAIGVSCTRRVQVSTAAPLAASVRKFLAGNRSNPALRGTVRCAHRTLRKLPKILPNLCHEVLSYRGWPITGGIRLSWVLGAESSAG